MSQQGINIRYLLILALGTNPKITDTVDEIYTVKELEYDELYRQSGFYNDIGFQLFSVRYAKQLTQISGIVEFAYKHNDFSTLKALIKRAFPAVYNASTNASYLSHERIIQIVRKIQPLIEHSEWGLLSIYTVFLYLETMGYAKIEPYAKSIFQRYLFDQYSLLQDNMRLYQARFDDKDEELKILTKNLLIEFNNKKKVLNFNQYFDQLIDKEHAHKVGIDIFDENAYKNMSFEQIAVSRDAIFKDGDTASLIGAITYVLKLFGFFETMFIHELTEEETKKFLHSVTNMFEANNLSRKGLKVEDFMVICGFALSILKEYQTAREGYESAITKEVYEKIRLSFENKIEKIEAQKELLNKELTSLKYDSEVTKEQNSTLQKELKAMQKENERLHKMIEKQNPLQREVVALRDHTFRSNDSYEDSESTISIDKMIKRFENDKIFVIGGHENWVKKMKEQLPSVTFIPIDKTGSLAQLKNDGINVIINTLSNKHANYKRVVSMLSNTSTLHYINSHVHIETSIKEIYNLLYKNSAIRNK
ncbi:hypothetical protein ABD87_15040 [Lysinibacillus sphaericus]|uniref:hypothetical protein n=1 Tax=Lysinibacillus sphaericus TaxID=1421 RepID=UPI0018CDDC5E|nr:hypothetical protein [Lysinibacillus sphaericus]MBG9730806.1 hypothetical protein [Lysinibacillus sphaericus]